MPRVSEESLRVSIRRRLGLWLGRVFSATPLHFDRHGMALLVPHALAPGGTVIVELQPRDGPIVRPVLAVVHNCRPTSEHEYRCGVQFRLDEHDADTVGIGSELYLLEQALRASEPVGTPS